MKRIFSVVILLAVASSYWVVSSDAQGSIEPGPIQTQIADLQATLTAIPTIGNGVASGNRSLSINDVTFEVTEFSPLQQDLQAKIQDDYPTLAQYYQLDVTVINNSFEPVNGFSLPWESFRITDSLGRSFSYANGPTYYLFGYEGMFMGDVQPGIPTAGFIIWELPADATGLVLTAEGAAESVQLS